MIHIRRSITRRVTLKTSSGKVEVWENSDGEVLELIYSGRNLQDIQKPEQSFEATVQKYRDGGCQVLISRQALEENAAFAA